MTYEEKIEKLALAIQLKKTVVITYNNEAKSRKINPYVVYNSTAKESKVTLDAFQVEGESVSDTLLKFKMFHVDKINSVVLHSDTFENHESYNRESERYVDAFAGMKN
jgi:predicted DNA-binding transcriptional regulator YafY